MNKKPLWVIAPTLVNTVKNTSSAFGRVWSFLTILALLLWVASPTTLRAQPAPAAGMLRQAYVTLSVADHDYKGHRIEAMKQIEAAAKLLNIDLRGDGKGHEHQGVSDEQMRAARSLLDQARAGLTGRPLKHVERAIRQIYIGLKIR